MNGWVACLLQFTIIGLMNIVAKFVAVDGYNVLAFMAQAMVAGGFVMLLLSRPGPLGIETLKSSNTWLYGLLYLAFNVSALLMLRHFDVAVVMLLTTFKTLLVFAFAWIFLGRRENWRRSILFQFLILGGLMLALLTVAPELRAVAIVGMFALGLLGALKVIAVETHAPNNKAKDFEQEVRVTGLVLAVTGMMAYVLVFSLAALNHTVLAATPLPIAPNFSQIINQQALIFGSIYGIFATSTIRYLEFYAVKRIKSEFYAAIGALLPLFGLGFELVADRLGIVAMHGIPPLQYVAMAAIMGASILIIFYGRAPQRVVAQAKRRSAQAKQDQLTASNALQHFNDDRRQTAQALSLPLEGLAVALGEQGKEQLAPELSQRMQELYIANIATRDGLTTLYNRDHFYTLLCQAITEEKPFILLYLDLNKFKPINDTYGHEAGDEALRQAAQRLREVVGRKAVISRLGGDEFAILLPETSHKKSQNVIRKIQHTITEPLDIPQVKEPLMLGVSIGQATYPGDGTSANDLLHHADQNMYAAKKSSS